MVMPTQPQRPVLTPDERSTLLNAEGHLQMINSVLADFEDIGVDTAPEREMFDRTERMRAGMLDRFSTQQISPTKNPRARK